MPQGSGAQHRRCGPGFAELYLDSGTRQVDWSRFRLNSGMSTTERSAPSPHVYTGVNSQVWDAANQAPYGYTTIGRILSDADYRFRSLGIR